MKKTILLFYLIIIQISLNGQSNFEKELDSLDKYAGTTNNYKNRVRVLRNLWLSSGLNHYKYINSAADSLLPYFFKYEKENWFNNKVCDTTSKYLSKIQNPYLLTLLDRSIVNYSLQSTTDFSNSDFLFFKNKMRNAIGEEQYIQSRERYPFYTYSTQNKQILKFIYLHHGNDLLALGAKNLDRDYTGSFQLELGTDLLNFKRRRPLKSYQTLMVGLEVYTANIRNSSALVDSSDRPFGAYQYLGWSKYVLSKSNNWRYYTRIKLGIIGGNGGEAFQNQLHTSVSFSKQSLGWENQIVNGGRIAYSIEHKIEREIQGPMERLYFQPFVENQFGTFMTKQSIGLNITNRNFAENSHHDVSLRNRQEIRFRGEFLKLYVNYKVSNVIHNTMLTGFGLYSDKEAKQLKEDIIGMNLSSDIIPFSKYVLEPDQIKSFTQTLSFGVSYSTSFATVIYRYYIFSPETKLDTQFLQNNYSWNLAERWHKFAEIGISLHLKN